MPHPVGSAQCPKHGCEGFVVTQCCRGTSNPDHDGYWYDVCNQPPGLSHFIRWRRDLPRYYKTGNPSFDVPELPTPPHPPPFSDYPIHSPLPAPNFSRSAPAGPSTTSSTQTPAKNLGAEAWKQCRGSKCQARAVPPRGCRTCTFYFCKACCLVEQPARGIACQELRHAAGSSSSSQSFSANPPSMPPSDFADPPISFDDLEPDSFTSSAPIDAASPDHFPSPPSSPAIPIAVALGHAQPTSSSTPSQSLATSIVPSQPAKKPLMEVHYKAREAKLAEVRARTDRKLEQERRKAEKKKSVTVYYWDTDCESDILNRLGLADGGFIENWEPEGMNWIGHTVNTAIFLDGIDKLLYRALGVTVGESMDHLISELTVQNDTRQATLTARQGKRPIGVSPTFTPDRNVRPRLSSQSSDSLPVSGDLSPLLDDGSTAGAPALRSVIPTGPDPLDESLALEPATPAKGPWPLKYVCFMARGFDHYDRLPPSAKMADKFKIAFSTTNVPSKSTWHKYYKRVWCPAPLELRQQYIDAGTTGSGLMLELAKEVLDGSPKVKLESSKPSTATPQVHSSKAANATAQHPVDPLLALQDASGNCKYCGRAWPRKPSDALRALEKNARAIAGSSKRPAYLAYEHVCGRHQGEASEELSVSWPTSIDFSSLADRVHDFFDELSAIWEDPFSSEFYQSCMLGASASSDPRTFTTGYYGPRGAAIIETVLRTLFPASSRHEMSYESFLRSVLVPEAATMLCSEDVGASQAEDVLRVSHEWGLEHNPDKGKGRAVVKVEEDQVWVSDFKDGEVIELD
ncbi:hypothetical protein FA95DRAFT_1570272 [Auriscalpium vulgare]|uniref:Uncharacterized protein n=1 Tax=Auriscalpium vulgare TaxID=40419 RepID=A0ACB8S4L6_9AGAM|nr:hypothetical protein FA95DRAFT_1570272 [Auriscalpium vulgare]